MDRYLCPYCDETFEDDSDRESWPTEITCPECGKTSQVDIEFVGDNVLFELSKRDEQADA